jgi:hypothetical protein
MNFDFKFENGNVIHCSYNGKGLICRATITPKGFTLKGEKVKKKNENDKAVTVGQVQQAFAEGKWHTMQIEMAGKDFVASTTKSKVLSGNAIVFQTK